MYEINKEIKFISRQENEKYFPFRLRFSQKTLKK